MNISELCRICMNSGCYFLSDQQLDMDGEEINSIDMLREFSTNDFLEFETVPLMICDSCSNELIKSYLFIQKLRRGEENLLDYLSATPPDPPQENDAISNDDFPDIDIIPSPSQSEETSDMVVHEADEQKPINYEIILPEDSPQKKRKTGENTSEVHKNIPKRFLSTAVDITNGESHTYMVSAFLPSSTIVKAPKACEPPKKSGAPDTSLSKTKVDEVRTIDYSVVRLSGTHDLDFEKNIPGETDPNTVYKCKYCPKAFANSHFLISHVKQVHVCQHCMASFPNRDELSSHTRSAHKTFSCAVCKRVFKCNSNLRMHIKQFHNLALPKHVSLISCQSKEGESEET
ncbi:hypothetical protein ACFFRR_001315 [Megaselia abdita]